VVRKLAVIVLALSLLTVSNAEAKKHHHKHPQPFQREIWYIINQLPSQWTPQLQETVADFNANMPEKGPLLVVIKGDPVICDTQIKRTITVCGGDGEYAGGEYWGLAWGIGHSEMSIWMDVEGEWIPDSPDEVEATLCHELMHEVGLIDDNYNAMPDTSCVWGNLTDLGPWDIARLHAVWDDGTNDTPEDEIQQRKHHA